MVNNDDVLERHRKLCHPICSLRWRPRHFIERAHSPRSPAVGKLVDEAASLARREVHLRLPPERLQGFLTDPSRQADGLEALCRKDGEF